MADFKFVILANANTNVLRINMYEATASNSVVATQDLNPPFTTSRQVSFLGLNNVTHIVRIYEVVSGTQGALLGQYQRDPEATNLTQDTVLEITAGLDMAANQDTFDGTAAFPQYIGLVAGVDYYVSRRGTGILRNDEYQDLGATFFGFKLLNGNVFNYDETFHITFYAKLSVSQSTTNNTISKWNDIKTIAGDVTLNNTYLGCILSINTSSDDAPTITMDIASNVPDLTPFRIINQLGTQLNGIIKCQTGMQFAYSDGTGNQIDTLYLGKCASIELVKLDNIYFVIDEDESAKTVGKHIYSYGVLLNTVEAAGQLLSRTKYARLWNWVQQTQSIISDNDWNSTLVNNKGFFSSGDGSTTFRIPDLRNQFIRGKKSTRTVGSWEDSENKKHNHGIASTANGPGANDTSDVMRGTYQGSVSTRGSEDTNGSNSKTIKQSGGDESRPINNALLTLICV